MSPQPATLSDLLGAPVVVVLATETFRNLKLQTVTPEGVLLLEELSDKTLRFFPWVAVKQIYRRLK